MVAKRGDWSDRGVILQSCLNNQVKGILALHTDKHQRVTPLLKPLVKRYSKTFSKNRTQMYKSWLNEREIAALIQILGRGLTLMDEHYEGTLNLRHILEEDEDVKVFFGQDYLEPSDIDDAFKF